MGAIDAQEATFLEPLTDKEIVIRLVNDPSKSTVRGKLLYWGEVGITVETDGRPQLVYRRAIASIEEAPGPGNARFI